MSNNIYRNCKCNCITSCQGKNISTGNDIVALFFDCGLDFVDHVETSQRLVGYCFLLRPGITNCVQQHRSITALNIIIMNKNKYKSVWIYVTWLKETRKNHFKLIVLNKFCCSYPNEAIMELHSNKFSTQIWIKSGLVPNNSVHNLISLWATSPIEVISQPICIANLNNSQQRKRNKEN